jgi:outer membrane protein, heavy metal efflux system
MKRKMPVVFAAAAAAAFAAAPAAPADDTVLAALVQEALANNPDIRALEESALAARAVPAQASALPDPMLSVGYTNEGWSPSLGAMPESALAVMVGQDLPWPGKRALRGRIAAAEAEQAGQQLARARLSIAAGVRRAYYVLAQARLLLELVQEQSQLWGQIEGVARARYTVGQGAQQDVLRTQVEVTRVGQLEAEQRAEEAVRLAELSRLLGRADGAPVEVRLDTLDAMQAADPEPPAIVIERLRNISPELAFARAAFEAARLGVDQARKDFKPDLTVRAGYMNRGGLEPMWQASASVNLPLARGRRRAALAEAEARRRAAEQRIQAVELQLRFRTQERLARLVAVGKMAALYAEGVVPQDRLAVEAAMASYQAGRVPFISVLESLGALYGDRGAYIRLLAARGQLVASLEEASLEATTDMPALPLAGMGGVPAMGARPMGEQSMRARSVAGMATGASMRQ